MFRTSSGANPALALEEALDWVAHMGGRDLLFRWMGENSFPLLLGGGPGAKGHDHESHGHGQGRGISPVGHSDDTHTKVKIPKQKR